MWSKWAPPLERSRLATTSFCGERCICFLLSKCCEHSQTERFSLIQTYISPVHTTLYVIVGLVSKLTWERIFCFADLVHCCLPWNWNIKLVPWQPMHQNPLDITCVLRRSFSLYSPNWSVTLLLSKSTLSRSVLYSEQQCLWICLIIKNTLKHPPCQGHANNSFWQHLFNETNGFLWCVCFLSRHIFTICLQCSFLQLNVVALSLHKVKKGDIFSMI